MPSPKGGGCVSEVTLRSSSPCNWHDILHVEQISPDKDVICHDTTAAFTLSLKSQDFVMLC